MQTTARKPNSNIHKKINFMLGKTDRILNTPV